MPSELSALEGFLILQDDENPFCPPALVMYIYNSFLFVQISPALSLELHFQKQIHSCLTFDLGSSEPDHLHCVWGYYWAGFVSSL